MINISLIRTHNEMIIRCEEQINRYGRFGLLTDQQLLEVHELECEKEQMIQELLVLINDLYEENKELMYGDKIRPSSHSAA